jgi:hypothetical protein
MSQRAKSQLTPIKETAVSGEYKNVAPSDDVVKLKEWLKLIAGHDDIFYGTNREVLL